MRRVHASIIAILTAAAIVAPSILGIDIASASGGDTISGVAYQDVNRNGAQDAGEAPFANHRIYLLNGTTGSYITNALTDAAGHYSFGGLADAEYRVEYEGNAWRSVRQDWVPTTTGTIYPRRAADLTTAADATIDFGWRRIVRSTTVGSPVTSVVGPSGLKVESYNDVVTAQQIHDHLLSGQLVGSEAAKVTIRFDYGTTSATATSVQTVDGRYDQFSAVVTAAWDSWLTTYDRTLFHEYGHAWSMYHAYIAQQDSSMAGYLRARGLEGDPRVGTSYGWDKGEMIAEDYRQLFGTATSAQYAQINSEIPHPSQVSGLREYLQGAFRQATAATPPPPAPATQPAVAISGLRMNPTSVSKSGTVSFELSGAASVTVEIRDAAGKLVRTIMSAAPKSTGNVSASWDRKDAAGRRAKPGSYSAHVTATGSTTATATTGFSVT